MTTRQTLAAYVTSNRDPETGAMRVRVTAYDSGIALFRQVLPARLYPLRDPKTGAEDAVAPLLNAAGAALEREGFILTGPWVRNSNGSFDYRAPFERESQTTASSARNWA